MAATSTKRKKRKKLGMVLLANMLKKFIKTGTLQVIEADETLTIFVGTPEPVATIRLHDPALPFKMFRNPELHTGEAYMDGTLTFEDCTLKDFLDLFSLNRGSMASYPLQKVLRRISRSVRSLQQHNPIGKAQRNVAHHYDLSAEMYSLFLDKDMQYSCAYFENGDESLEEAQEKKKRHIAAKLKLEDGQRILDIGCGWGGMALYLADTLVKWNKRFQTSRDRIAEIYDERFCRMWEFYLLSAETMFRTGAQMVFQMQLSRIREATGLTRDYIFKTEEIYRKQETRQDLPR